MALFVVTHFSVLQDCGYDNLTVNRLESWGLFETASQAIKSATDQLASLASQREDGYYPPKHFRSKIRRSNRPEGECVLELLDMTCLVTKLNSRSYALEV